jgi:sugar phosphate isomerase/epimerase
VSCKVGLAEWRLPAAGPEAVRLARRVGADGLQLDFGGPGRGELVDGPGRIEAVRAAAVECAIELLALAGNQFNDVGLLAEPGIVRPLLTRLLDAAVGLGVPLVILPSFRRSAIDGPVSLRRTADVLRWAATEAAARGIVLANENVLAGDQARRLAEEIASPAFRLVLDTFNPVVAGRRPADLVASAGDVLADQIHLKDGPPAVGPSPLLGAGSGRLDETVAALRRHQVPVRALVLENDYRDEDSARLAADLAWARRRAELLDADHAIRGAGE